ncbi:hypothetical protein NUM_06300 [Actinocatenispora comari]|uniref:Uncharacterized protein n=1 Tax=Actinocatenispora comari TaxID=2807577 RepID=A0A8J4EIV9_9ACTN|nr:hypothetical protein NUM_06300 [Actinocatenispora comari]
MLRRSSAIKMSARAAAAAVGLIAFRAPRSYPSAFYPSPTMSASTVLAGAGKTRFLVAVGRQGQGLTRSRWRLMPAGVSPRSRPRRVAAVAVAAVTVAGLAGGSRP